jgi:hypothetical protein
MRWLMKPVRARLLSCDEFERDGSWMGWSKHVRPGSRLLAWSVALLLAAAAGAAQAQGFTIRISAISNQGDGVVTSSPGGLNCTMAGQQLAGTCTATFPTGTVVTLSATPGTLNTFGGWGNAVLGCPQEPTCQLTNQGGLMDVRFTPARFTLTISGIGNGSGRVIGNSSEYPDWFGEGAITCNIVVGVTSGVCTTQYAYNRPIELRFENLGNIPAAMTFLPPCTSTGQCELIMPAGPVTVVGQFLAPGFRVVSAGGAGTGRVVSTGGDAGIDCTVSPAGVAGTCYKDYGAKAMTSNPILQATAAPGSVFLGWSGGSCSGTGTCVYGGDGASITDFAANFGLAAAALTVSGAGTGSGAVVSSPAGVSCTVSGGSTSGTCSGTFATATVVTLQATPNAGSTFGGWTGGGCSGTGTCSLTMSAAQSVTAQFTAVTPTISVTGAGSGSVSSAPAGIACTITNGTASGTCASPFAYGTDLTLTAAPASGWTFAGWGGVCTGTGTCKPDVTADRAVTATFVPLAVATVALKVTGAGSGDGIVTSSPGGLHCVVTKGAGNDAGCTALLPQNAAVTLTADPQGASIFAGWAGNGCSGAALTCTLTLSEARNVVAHFMAPRKGREIATMMLSGAALPADERAQLDRFGNKDGVLNLGDLLALLDRTGEHLTPAATAALVAAGRRGTGTPTTPTTPQRRTP